MYALSFEQAYATTVAEEHPEGLPGMEDDDDEMDEILIPPFSTSAQNDDDDDGIEIIEPNPDDSGYEEIVMGFVCLGLRGLNDFLLTRSILCSTSSQISPKTNNPLRTFLAVSMLATDAETEDSKNDANARVRFCLSLSLVFFSANDLVCVVFSCRVEGDINDLSRC